MVHIHHGFKIANSSKIMKLFKSNFSAFSLKFSFELFSFCFGSTLFEDFRSTVNYFFSFFQAKSCSFTYNFDNFNFVRANLCLLYVELVFLLSCCFIACCFCNYNSCCFSYAEIFLTCFYKIV